MKFVEKVKNTFDEYDYETRVYNIKDDKTKYYLHLDQYAIIYVDEKEKTIDIAFNLLTKPDEAAKITLISFDIKNLKNISIMDSYFFDQNGEILKGKEAVSEFMRLIAEQELMKSDMLKDMKCFNC